jgi:hypothetical protein
LWLPLLLAIPLFAALFSAPARAAEAGVLPARPAPEAAPGGDTTAETAAEASTDGTADEPAVDPGSAEDAQAEAACDCGCPDCSSRAGTLEFYGPLAAINTHPPNLLFLEPPPASAIVLAPGARELQTSVQWTNIIIREHDSGTQLYYDYEGLRATAAYHQGFDGGELSVELPFYSRGAGVLDGIISTWHGWFGFPNGLRDRYPDNKYHYVIVKRDGLVYSDGGDASGIGDLSVGYKRQLWNKRQGQDAMAVRAMFKAPTGDAQYAMGSGGWDASLGLLYQRQLRPHLRVYGNLDYVWTGAPDWKNIENNNLLITQFALEYAASRRTTVHSMYRLGANPLRTGSTQGDKNPQELGFGFAHRVAGDMVWTGGFVEDIAPETAPDFVITTGLKWSF